jgi:hypothetical protein
MTLKIGSIETVTSTLDSPMGAWRHPDTRPGFLALTPILESQ